MSTHRGPLLLAVISLFSQNALAGPALAASSQAGFTYDDLAPRWNCAGQLCGYSSQLCCVGGSQCYTDINNQAQCGTAPTQAQAGAIVITVTVGSTSPTQAVQCNQALNQVPCGNICCASGQYCYTLNQCVAAGGGSSSAYFGSYNPVTSTTTVTPGAPIRQTSSTTVFITSTRTTATTITSTIPFLTPVATGANITLSGQMLQGGGGGGLSGGAIAGIVIGVLAALALLALLCFCCCIKGIFDGIMAIFGLGRRRSRTEVEEYERRSHHGRTWFGGASRPSRVSRPEERKSHEGRNLFGIGVLLAGLWAILGLKRRRNENRRQEEKRSEYSYNSSYYTSASSASSDDRRPPPRPSQYARSSSRRG